MGSERLALLQAEVTEGEAAGGGALEDVSVVAALFCVICDDSLDGSL